jgi:IMP dehydrogenase/GMP reductase
VLQTALVVIAALVGLAGTTFGPIIAVRMANNQRDEERQQDWARQDARDAAAAARIAETERRLLAANARVVAQQTEASAIVLAQLGGIHVLVNSNLTETERRELAATIEALEARKENVNIKRQHGEEPSPNDIEQMDAIQKRIDTLTRDIHHKAEQTRKADVAVSDAEEANASPST